MKILRTFVPGLYSFKYPDEQFDELERLFDEWIDTEILFTFFADNKCDLKFFDITVEEAVTETTKKVYEIQKVMKNFAEQENPDLDSLFINLNDMDQRISPMSLQKSKKKFRWLRIYAIRIDSNYYVITGGTIKLTKNMSDRSHTKREFDKLVFCKNFLVAHGVSDIDTFNEIEI